MNESTGNKVVYSARALGKQYPGVKALSGVNLDLRAGAVHALLGENGAGKSTLVKILTGVIRPDAGEMLLDGAPVTFQRPLEASTSGIAVVHQERNVVPLMSVAENLTLHDPPRKAGLLDLRTRRAIVEEVAERLSFDFDLSQPIKNLSVAQVQLVEIGKALAFKSRVLVLDEPTASLTDDEAQRLFSIVSQLRDEGQAVVFVSHKLEEVFSICDDVTILRDGKSVIESRRLEEFKLQDVVTHMVGRELAQHEVRMRSPQRDGSPYLELSAVKTAAGHQEIDLKVHPGEIVGLYGLVGAGRSELVRSVLGLGSILGGDILVEGRKSKIGSVGEALDRYRIGYVTEDRKNEGLFLDKDVRFNVSATIWRRMAGWLGVRPKDERETAAAAIAQLSIKVSSDRQLVGQLSGGNQQKVSLSKWLAASTKLLIVDEPTVGVDVRTKGEFQELLMDLADAGMAILLIDSDLPEMVNLADRILVMHEYRLATEIENSKEYGPMSQLVAAAIHGADE